MSRGIQAEAPKGSLPVSCTDVPNSPVVTFDHMYVMLSAREAQ